MSVQSEHEQPAVRCVGLTKDYGGGHGVFDLDITIAPGEVYGFIGANGAGKTTTMRLLMGLIRPDRGRMQVLGLDAVADSLALKRLVGYLPGELPQYPGVRAAHVIGLLAGLRGGVDEARISALAERLQLDVTRRYSDLSHGNRQKVGLIAAFMHRPRLLILDEPTLGLDPLMQREVRALVQEAVHDGATCLLSSHVLAEVEAVCDSIGLIRDGRLLRQGSLVELREVRAHSLQATMAHPLSAAQVAEFSGLPGVTKAQHDGLLLTAEVQGAITPALRWLVDAGVTELDSRELSLEEVFLAEYANTP